MLIKNPVRFLTIVVAPIIVLLAGCAANPVTGKSELAFVSTAQEVRIGEQQYGPSRQMSGGDYVVDRALTRYVSEVGNRLVVASKDVVQSDRNLPYEFAVVNDSTPNAWALPGGKIAVHRGLLTELGSEAELAAVLGHEIVHAAARHGAKSMQRGTLLQGAMMAGSVLAQGNQYGSLLMTGSGLAAQLLTQKYGRDAERQSDEYGMQFMSRAGYDPRAAVDLQETFVRLSAGRNSDWLSGLFSSHPPSPERVENNRRTAATLPAGGEYGRESYQQNIARIVKLKPAYEAHDQGRKALAEGDIDKALSLAKKALAAEDAEPIFHALRGDVRYTQKRYKDALVNYDRAVERSPAYFYSLMRRGLTHKKIGNASAATSDLEASIKLLPTDQAMNALGELRLAGGNQAEAMELFRAAAGNKSPAGIAATESLMRLELSEKPQRYLKVRLGLDRSNRIIAEVGNPTTVPVQVTQLVVQYRDQSGQINQVERNINLSLPAGKAGRIATGLGPLADASQLSAFRAGVGRARIAE